MNLTKFYTRKIIGFVLVAIVVVAGHLFFLDDSGPEITSTPSPSATAGHALINVTSPKANDLVRSPLIATGRARGNWYFEASFPIALYDAEGRELAKGYAMTSENWMTTEFVSFESIPLVFSTPKTETGVLVLSKDNPSALPEHDDEIRIPVRFVR